MTYTYSPKPNVDYFRRQLRKIHANRIAIMQHNRQPTVILFYFYFSVSSILPRFTLARKFRERYIHRQFREFYAFIGFDER
jgi:hypothetical protein